jgi:hypothetical protein
MTHCLHGGHNHGNCNGFAALGKTIGTSKSGETDADYVTEHRVLKNQYQFTPCLFFYCFKFTHCLSMHSNKSKSSADTLSHVALVLQAFANARVDYGPVKP